MPVHRYKSVAEMGDTGSVRAGDPRLARIMRDVWEFSARLATTTPPRGVRRFRNIEESNRARQLWCEQRASTDT